MTAIRLFLRALDFPALDTYKIENTESDQSLITWLEHTKIRLYAVDNRAPLHSTDTAMWHAALKQYLADVHCPVAWNNGNNRLTVLQWLLNHAGEALLLIYEEQHPLPFHPPPLLSSFLTFCFQSDYNIQTRAKILIERSATRLLQPQHLRTGFRPPWRPSRMPHHRPHLLLYGVS